MQFSKVITLIFAALLTLVSASAIPATSNSLTTRGTENATVTADGPPFCSGTGPGVCNMAFAWYQGAGQVNQFAFIYDRFCNEIGAWAGADANAFDMPSPQLPYVIVGYWESLEFWYAGSHYGDNCIEYKYSIYSVKQCAFHC